MPAATFHEHHLDVDAVVVGAGPAGLAAARALSERGVPYRHLEKGSMVGGLVAAYLEPFADRFSLTEDITFNSEVTAVAPLAGDGAPGEDGWRVTTATGEAVTTRNVLVATGHQVSLPFLDPSVLEVTGNELPLYQRVVAPERPGLYLLGFIQTVGTNIALLEHQAQWVADLLTGSVALPEVEQMRRWIRRGQRAMAKRYLRSERHTMQVDDRRYIRAIAQERRRVPGTDLHLAPRPSGAGGGQDGSSPTRGVSGRMSAALRQVSQRAGSRTGR